MAWRWPGDKPLSEPMMVSVLTHICVTRPQWVNSSTTVSCVTNYKSKIFKFIVLNTLKPKDHQFGIIVAIEGTVSCHNDNLPCPQWWQSCQIGNILFSVYCLIHPLWNAVMCKSKNLTNEKSTLVQATASCHQATCHYMGQRAISQEMFKICILHMSLKSTNLRLQ